MNTADIMVFSLIFVFVIVFVAIFLIVIGLLEYKPKQPTDSLEALQRNWDDHVSREAKRMQEQPVERRKGGS